MAIKENELTELTTLGDDDKIRVVSTLNGLSQVITARRLKDSFLLTGSADGVVERIAAIEAVIDNDKPLATQEALNTEVEKIRADLGYQSDEANQPTKVFQRILILESEVNSIKEFGFVDVETNLQEALDRLYILDGGSVEGTPSGLVYRLQADVDEIKNIDLETLIDTTIVGAPKDNLVTISGAQPQINLAEHGTVFTHSVTDNTVYNITGTPFGVYAFTIIATQGSTGKTLNFLFNGTNDIRWEGGTAPVLNSSNTTYVLKFISVDQGLSWLAKVDSTYSVI